MLDHTILFHIKLPSFVTHGCQTERLDFLALNVDLLTVFAQHYWSLLDTLVTGVGLEHLFLFFALVYGLQTSRDFEYMAGIPSGMRSDLTTSIKLLSPILFPVAWPGGECFAVVRRSWFEYLCSND